MITLNVGDYICYKQNGKTYGVTITKNNKKLYDYELENKEIEIFIHDKA